MSTSWKRASGLGILVAVALLAAMIPNAVATGLTTRDTADGPSIRLSTHPHGPRASKQLASNPTETQDPLGQDAAWLGQAMGLPVDETYRRLRLQEIAGDLEQKLEQDAASTFGGLWLDQGPEFRVMVALTEGGDSAAEPYVKRTDLEGLTEVVIATYALGDLRSWAEGFLGTAIAEFGSTEGKFDLGVDIPANRIVVRASSDAWLSRLENMLLSDLQANASAFSFEVGSLAEPSVNIYAGLGLSGGCTTGFSTRTTTGGQRGITTAAHCPNTESYSGQNLPFQAGDMQGNQDVQWHSLSSGVTAQPRAVDNTGYRTITGTLGRAGQPVGALVCGYGVTSGYRCGRIAFKDFAPSYINSPSPTFMVLHQTGVDLSNPGDSGGPWYSGGIAYGIHSGERDQVDAIYMAINYISSLKIAVLTG